jgi:hypothetical protein
LKKEAGRPEGSGLIACGQISLQSLMRDMDQFTGNVTGGETATIQETYSINILAANLRLG